MDEKERVQETEISIPYAAFEREMARADQRDRRHWIAHGFMAAVIVAVVALFLAFFAQYDFESYEQDGAGVNVMGNMMGSMNGGRYTNGTETDSP